MNLLVMLPPSSKRRASDETLQILWQRFARINVLTQCGKLEVLNEVLNYIYKTEKQTIRRDDESGWLDKMMDAIRENGGQI